MTRSDRRRFMQTLAATPLVGVAESSTRAAIPGTGDPETVVKLFGDGLALSPSEYVRVLESIVEKDGIEPDNYSRGGVVEKLESRMADALGKERAIYFPTGTLANHVAIRRLAGERTRVLVPRESHIYNDSGDCAQQLSQLNLVPLASDTATFTLDQVKEVVERTRSGRVTTGVGAIAIESPVRRRLGELFDYDEMRAICAYARDHDIKTHLDGARLYMASGYTGVSPREYASHFDSVYVSLWKYFNGGSGAVLAGSRELVDELYHTRRMFGGGLPSAWQFAAVALHYLENFETEFARAVGTAKELFATLEKDASFEIEEIPNGSNLFIVRVDTKDLEGFRERLTTRGALLSRPRSEIGGFVVAVNATWNRTSASALAKAFKESV